MKRIALLAITLIAGAVSCLKNDMMIPKDLAGFEIFEVEGQITSSINSSTRTVTITMPNNYADLSGIAIHNVKFTSNTVACNPQLAAGIYIDLSSPMTVTLSAYRDFEWTIIAVRSDSGTAGKQEQLYNMSFDDWSKANKGWYPYAENADDASKLIWGTSNKGTSGITGKNTTEPEENFVAVAGEGKKAAKLSSQYILVKFAAGNIFTGEFCGLIGMSGAELAWGVPFSSRPKSLKGHYCYQPVAIDYAEEPYKDMLGKMDSGHIFVILADWDKNPNQYTDEKGRFHVINSKEQFVDIENDPAIIGYAKMTFDEWMDSYKEFELKIDYRNDRTPSVVAIVAASSRYGDYFTGGKGTVLYLDEFSFVY